MAWEAEVRIENWERWRKLFEPATFEKAAKQAVEKPLEKAANVYATEMRNVLRPYHWQSNGGVYSSVDVMISKGGMGGFANARIGPGVKKSLPEEAEVVATGRGKNKRTPPFGQGSKLYRWATEKGIDTKMVYFIARRIGQLGIPNQYSRNWPDEPGYVEETLRRGENKAGKALKEIPHEIVKIAVRRV